jgi:hypothetical protein
VEGLWISWFRAATPDLSFCRQLPRVPDRAAPELDDPRAITDAAGSGICRKYSAIWRHAGPENRSRTVIGAGLLLARK